MPTIDDIAGRKLGPRTRRLICHKMALLAVPPNTKNPISAGAAALADIVTTGAHWKEAAVWCCRAVDVVKTAPDNPYGNDDEAIAQALLDGIEARKRLARASVPKPGG